MDINELSRKSYLLEDWHDGSATGWHELSSKGWAFTRPSYNPWMVGITMSRETCSATFFVDRKLPVDEVGSRLLLHCKMFDRVSVLISVAELNNKRCDQYVDTVVLPEGISIDGPVDVTLGTGGFVVGEVVQSKLYLDASNG